MGWRRKCFYRQCWNRSRLAQGLQLAGPHIVWMIIFFDSHEVQLIHSHCSEVARDRIEGIYYLLIKVVTLAWSEIYQENYMDFRARTVPWVTSDWMMKMSCLHIIFSCQLLLYKSLLKAFQNWGEVWFLGCTKGFLSSLPCTRKQCEQYLWSFRSPQSSCS